MSTIIKHFRPVPASLRKETLSGTDGVTYYLFNTFYIISDAAINKSKAVEVIDTGVHFGQANVMFDETSCRTKKF